MHDRARASITTDQLARVRRDARSRIDCNSASGTVKLAKPQSMQRAVGEARATFLSLNPCSLTSIGLGPVLAS